MQIKNLKLFYILFLFIAYPAFADIDSKVIQKAKKASVAIKVQASLVPYGSSKYGEWFGSGFIVDKERGLIVTNNHVSGKGGVCSYELTFENGKKADARLLYFDLWQDFAILKIDPKEIPNDAVSLEFSKTDPKYGDEVFIVGNAEGQNLSVHTGYITGLYEIRGFLPQQVYVVNFVKAGGSSGSPLMDKDGRVIGIIFSASESYGNAVNYQYIQYALDSLIKDQVPIRNHIGAICQIVSLDGSSDYLDFPKELHKEYEKLDPQMRRRILLVGKTITGTPSNKVLKSGDIIWKVNGKIIGASLYDLDQAMNESKDKVHLEIYRQGKKMNFAVDLYDINKNKIKEIVELEGGIFFLSDDYTSAITGIPIGSLSIMNINQGSLQIAFNRFANDSDSSLNAQYAIHPVSFAGQEVRNLNDLIKIIPTLTKKKKISIISQMFYMYQTGYNGIYISSHDELLAIAKLDGMKNNKYYYLDEKSLEWKSENIE